MKETDPETKQGKDGSKMVNRTRGGRRRGDKLYILTYNHVRCERVQIRKECGGGGLREQYANERELCSKNNSR
jgi:hypothetical protein